jgi:hypothetical protein
MRKRCDEMCCGKAMWLSVDFRGIEHLKCDECGFHGER